MKKLILLFLLVMTFGCSYAEVAVDYSRLAPHPRLLLSKGGEERIRRIVEIEPLLLNVHNRVIRTADESLTNAPVERIKQGKRLLAVSREALSRIFSLAYAYRMTGQEEYAKRAEKEMNAVSEMIDWNPSHFLDVGEIVMAVAIGYDWLYDVISEETKEKVRKALVEKGFNAADNKKDAWFYDSKTNWNSVCNGGLTYGALAIYEDEPDISKHIIDKCLETNPKALGGYGPDGGYPEGFMYWGYGTAYQVMLIAALESSLGSDFGLASAPGFLQSSRFMQYMTAPSGSCFNFSDAGSRPTANMMLYWFAGKLKDPSLLYLERNYLKDESMPFAEVRLLPSLMVFASQVDMNSISAPKNPYWFNRGDTPVFIYRSGWDSKDDTYLGVKGGSPSTSHAHMDAGSFIYEKEGVRWSMDLGMQNYYSLESVGVDLWNQRQDGQRWDVYRIGNQSHNTLTINGERHNVKGKAEITERFTEADKKGAVVDLTSTFEGNLKRAMRSVILDKDDNLDVVDNLIAMNDKPADIMWVMATAADAKIIDENTIELEKEGKRMQMKVEAGKVPVKMQIWSNDPPHDYDQPNPGSRRVGFTAKLNSGEAAMLKIRLESVK